MNNAGNSTHKARAVDPKTFRNAATGIGQRLADSISTGARRAQQAINDAPASQRACADPSYPAPTMSPDGSWLPVEGDGMATISPVQLKRAGR